MAYSCPCCRCAGDQITVCIWNTCVVGNIKETAVAKVTTAGDLTYATAANTLSRLAITNTRVLTSACCAPAWTCFACGTVFDGDHLDIDFTPTNYTPCSTCTAEAADVDDLSAHLAGIDNKIGTLNAAIATGTYTGDGTTSQGITGVGFAPKFVWIHERSTTEAAIEAKGSVWTTDTMVDDNACGIMANLGDASYYDNGIISLDADGFTVDDDGADSHPNKNSHVYNYMAMG